MVVASHYFLFFCQMDPPEQEKGEEHNAETSSDEHNAETSSDEPRVYPRIGDQHQVEIPNMATEAESVQLILSSTDNNNIISFDYTFGLGLPIPIVCIQNSSRQNVEYSLLPNSPTLTWSDAEAQSFLLGLYIFGKNLIQLRQFLGSKTMGDILSYYYGKFYGSDAYCKWSQCRKIKSRRGIIGQRIFTSWRQQELLSRLMPTIPIEAQHLLSEVCFDQEVVSIWIWWTKILFQFATCIHIMLVFLWRYGFIKKPYL